MSPCWPLEVLFLAALDSKIPHKIGFVNPSGEDPSDIKIQRSCISEKDSSFISHG